jgi:prepilin-type N-terminal cleavage/methylation domain-containing protein
MIPMNAFKKTGGFTLVELIIVIAILAILSSVAVAGYSSYIKKANDSAVLAELNNISTAATLANAKAGGIKSITVAKVDGKLQLTIVADSTFANDFADLMDDSITTFVVTDNETTTKGTIIATMALPSAWDASEYADDTKVEWTGSWPKAVQE